MPVVSICLPVYNGQSFLVEAIESVLAQTFDDYELLICDDGSDDSSLEIALDYARRDKRISAWKNSHNLGLFANYNVCMARATGKYIKPFAQDDLLAPQTLKRMLEPFSIGTDIALVSCRRAFLDQDEVQEHPAQFDSTRLIEGRELIKGCLPDFLNWIGEPCAVMFPSSLIGEGFDTSFHHLGDLEYWFRIASNGNYIFLNEPLCTFRHHPGSTSNKNVTGMFFVLDALKLGRLYLEYLTEAGLAQDEYIQRTIETSAHIVNYQTRHGKLSLEEALAVPVAGADKDELLKQFRELAYHSLYFLSDALTTSDAVKLESDESRKAFEQRLQDSRIWPHLVQHRTIRSLLRL